MLQLCTFVEMQQEAGGGDHSFSASAHVP